MDTNKNYQVEIYPPSRQGSGSFDNGKITEIKPIDFPNGTGEGKRIGPLFYWAWASANGDGIIGMHPHQAFEIISYVLKGEIGHTDSLSNKTRVGAGGAQIMQTGSGVYHQEEMYGERTEFFQIWFEPNLRETIKSVPTYTQLPDKEFPAEKSNGTIVKKILGEGSPVKLVAESNLEELTISLENSYIKKLKVKKVLALVAISGKGEIIIEDETYSIEEKYYTNIIAENDISINFRNTGINDLRLVIVEVPQKVNYPLYGEN